MPLSRRPRALLRSLRSPLAAVSLAALVLAACTTPEEAPPPPVIVPALAPVALNQSVADAASIYVAFIRDVSTINGGFASAESIQAAMRKGSAYEAGQISRGMIAYASILALQSPEFVASVRGYATTPETRDQMIRAVLADPAYAAGLPGADKAAGLIVSTLARDIVVLTAIAEAVEGDAYTIQERTDPRRAWAIAPVADRVQRLEAAKTASAQPMLPSPQDAAQLFAAAHNGSGLGLSPVQSGPPYSPVVARALTIAALAALSAGGEDGKVYTDALTNDADSQFCYNLSKLNLYQCLAASRPSYEDMFCVGRHIMRDLATCATGAIGGVPSVTQPPVVQTAMVQTPMVQTAGVQTSGVQGPVQTGAGAPEAPVASQVAPTGTAGTARPYLAAPTSPTPAPASPTASLNTTPYRPN